MLTSFVTERLVLVVSVGTHNKGRSALLVVPYLGRVGSVGARSNRAWLASRFPRSTNYNSPQIP